VNQDALIGKQECDPVVNECGVGYWGEQLLCCAKRIRCSVLDVRKSARCSGRRIWCVML